MVSCPWHVAMARVDVDKIEELIAGKERLDD
jgi:hypothetical protein